VFAILKSPPDSRSFDLARAELVSIHGTEAGADAVLVGEMPDDSWYAMVRIEIRYELRVKPEHMSVVEFWRQDRRAAPSQEKN
jgi:hypothetical protein